MPLRPAGYEWLKAHYGLSHSLTHSSFLGSNNSMEMTSQGNVKQVYGTRYAPAADTPPHHIEFALKYDGMNLDLLGQVCRRLAPEEVTDYIRRVPAGRYSRMIGFLYEWLTGKELPLDQPIAANYIDVLDPEKYMTATVRRNVKWKINDNLLGSAEYCPVIRKKGELLRLLEVDVTRKLNALREQYSEEVFQRAAQYLYRKETRSSYAIEKETPPPDRTEKFIGLLMKAGDEPTETVLGKDQLIQLQNAIVDARYAAKDARNFQNYVGESLPDFDERFHYICPPPSMVTSLMNGLISVAKWTLHLQAQVRAAMISFGFVFIHPFEDGNGRLHRFLIHQVLVRDGIVPGGTIIPVSAHMLSNMNDYARALEKYSVPLMQRIRYTKKDNEELVITNPDDVDTYFRYPDLTDQVVYLADTIAQTLEQDMPMELEFQIRFDEAKMALQEIVDMPDKKLGNLLMFLHQNKGVFPKRRREQFAELTDEEINRMEVAYRKVYDLKVQ
jgi:hypothetical protein